MIIQGDCLEKLKELKDNSVDSIVTDPPYELGFMGKSWDNTGVANNKEMWAECLRVLKPGGHLLAFSGTRTYHRMASAIEGAGFEVRDMIEWVYGSGFPKSLNIGKAVDKLQGNERIVIGKEKGAGTTGDNQVGNQTFVAKNQYEDGTHDITKGTSAWEGWGTALKPAHEPICMARKPIEGTVAQNCLKWGTGGINIDESRVEGKPRTTHKDRNYTGNKGGDFLGEGLGGLEAEMPSARFPANLLHDNSEEVRECFPETKSTQRNKPSDTISKPNIDFGGGWKSADNEYNDSGNASRFFKSIIYQAKASKSERNKGLDDFETKQSVGGGGGIGNYLNNVNSASGKFGSEKAPAKNNHPTVKPIALMEYLIKMVTPKGGIVLDPFAGSGSTLVAAKQNGFKYIGIELTEEYIPIIEARLSAVETTLF